SSAGDTGQSGSRRSAPAGAAAGAPAAPVRGREETLIVGNSGLTEKVEPALERAEADEPIALEVLLAEAPLDHLAMELLHAAGQVVLEPEVGQEPGEAVEVDPIVPRVGADLPGVDDPGRGDQSPDLVAHVAHPVVLAVGADVDRPVVDGLPGGPGEGRE